MQIRYKLDIISALKESGYNTTRILRENLISQGAMQRLRRGEAVSFDTLSRLCDLLSLQPGDILECVPDAPEAPENMD